MVQSLWSSWRWSIMLSQRKSYKVGSDSTPYLLNYLSGGAIIKALESKQRDFIVKLRDLVESGGSIREGLLVDLRDPVVKLKGRAIAEVLAILLRNLKELRTGAIRIALVVKLTRNLVVKLRDQNENLRACAITSATLRNTL